MAKEKLCPDCKERPLKYYHKRYTLRCIPCTIAYDVVRRKEYYEKSTKVMDSRVCEKCNKEYTPRRYAQRYCRNPCSSRKTEIEKFLGRQL
jgi:hypothetical protein